MFQTVIMSDLRFDGRRIGRAGNAVCAFVFTEDRDGARAGAPRTRPSRGLCIAGGMTS